MKGALSVAASAYKALFSGPPVTAQVSVWFLFLNFSPSVTSTNGSVFLSGLAINMAWTICRFLL